MTYYSNPRKDGPQTANTQFNKRLETFYNMYSKLDDGSLGKFTECNIPDSFIKEVEQCLSIDFKTFKEILEAIYKVDQDYDKLYEMGIAITYSSAYEIAEKVLKVLEKVLSDNSHWIEYFVYELKFGKEYEKGTITFDGQDIPLATIEDLWKLLCWEIALSVKKKSENS